MIRHTLLLVVAFALLVTPAIASPITYTFTGEAGLAGGFTLDDEADWVLQTEGFGTSGVLSSPLHTLWGSYGAYDFVGTPTLHVFDYADPDYPMLDHWIVRSPITFSSGGTLAITHLNLFVYQQVNGIGLTPPVVSSPDQFNFQYTVGLSDQSFAGGPLQSLVPGVSDPVQVSDLLNVSNPVKVSEPPSFLLPLFALVAIAITRFFIRT